MKINNTKIVIISLIGIITLLTISLGIVSFKYINETRDLKNEILDINSPKQTVSDDKGNFWENFSVFYESQNKCSNQMIDEYKTGKYFKETLEQFTELKDSEFYVYSYTLTKDDVNFKTCTFNPFDYLETKFGKEMNSPFDPETSYKYFDQIFYATVSSMEELESEGDIISRLYKYDFETKELKEIDNTKNAHVIDILGFEGDSIIYRKSYEGTLACTGDCSDSNTKWECDISTNKITQVK